mgnify:FL=1
MTATAFAHKVAAKDPSPELLSYLSMGGALEDICGSTDQEHFLGVCEACLISANALMPERTDDISLRFDTRTADVTALDDAIAIHARTNRTHPTRAPPAA